MNGLTKSEEKTLKYLQQMFPGYVWGKTAGGGLLDFMGAPPEDSELPMLFVESKCDADRTRDSQNEWAKSELGLRCKKYVIYTPSNIPSTPCFLYSWDDFLLFVEDENIVARVERKEQERATKRRMESGQYRCTRNGVNAIMRVDENGIVIVLKDSTFSAQSTPSCLSHVLEIRNKLLGDGTLVPSGEFFTLTKNVEFNSTSAAASAVLGASASGPAEWIKE